MFQRPFPATGRGVFSRARIASACLRFARTHAVLLVSALAAAATMLVVPPDASYLGYFDLKTLACLFGILALVWPDITLLIVAVVFAARLIMSGLTELWRTVRPGAGRARSAACASEARSTARSSATSNAFPRTSCSS